MARGRRGAGCSLSRQLCRWRSRFEFARACFRCAGGSVLSNRFAFAGFARRAATRADRLSLRLPQSAAPARRRGGCPASGSSGGAVLVLLPPCRGLAGAEQASRCCGRCRRARSSPSAGRDRTCDRGSGRSATVRPSTARDVASICSSTTSMRNCSRFFSFSPFGPSARKPVAMSVRVALRTRLAPAAGRRRSARG